MMPVLDFEEVLDRFRMWGKVKLIEGHSTEEWPADRLETDLIQLDQPWSVCFKFQTQGDLCEIICGKWKLCLLFEKMGGGEFSYNPCETIEFAGGPKTYHAHIRVPKRQVPEGVYRIVATLRLYGPTGRPGPVAAFVDMGLVQFYED
jgi:hypothetical protein